jgi:hypothetical protein
LKSIKRNQEFKMHGGKRQGAGRKVGSLTKKTQEIVAKAASQGLMPLEYMLNVLRDETQTHDERFKAAINAAPYLHPKLSSVEHKGDPDNPLEQNSRVELVVIDAGDSQGIRPSQAGAITQTRPI